MTSLPIISFDKPYFPQESRSNRILSSPELQNLSASHPHLTLIRNRIDLLKQNITTSKAHRELPLRIATELDLQNLNSSDQHSFNYLLRLADINGINRARFIELYRSKLENAVNRLVREEPFENPVFDTLKAFVRQQLQDPRTFIEDLKNNMRSLRESLTTVELLHYCQVQLRTKADTFWESQIQKLESEFKSVVGMIPQSEGSRWTENRKQQNMKQIEQQLAQLASHLQCLQRASFYSIL